MKNSTLLLLLIAAVTFTGCKKDDDEKAADNIIGKWYEVSSLETEYKNGTQISQETITNNDPDNYTEFRSNGTAVDGDGDEYTYKITGKTLTMREVGDDDDEVYEIKKITSGDLVIYGENTYQDGNNNYRYTTESTFKKK
jgi:hypothetical protein